ncbi:MAG: ABC transporter substrate-binding protein [Zetaproteobacteria bacterium]|nr:ABC transporter substrate-binding protein [Zetaproteobacteria bacterium]
MRLFKYFVSFVVLALGQKTVWDGCLGKGPVEYRTNSSKNRTFDPVQINSLYDNTMVTAVYETLLDYKYLKEPFELKPELAEEMPVMSKDGLTFSIKLKKGIYFADDGCFMGGQGREVVAQDVAYSILRHFDPNNASTGKWLLQGRIVGLDAWGKRADYAQLPAGIQIKGTHHLEIKLVKPFPQFMYALAMGYLAVIPKEAVDKYDKDFPLHPVGSGPWKVAHTDRSKVILERQPKYRREIFDLQAEGYDPVIHKSFGVEKLQGKRLPIVDRVVVSFIQEPAAQWNSFTKGDEIQSAGLPPEQLEQVLQSRSPITLKKEYQDKYRFHAAQEFGYIFTDFNMEDKDFGVVADPKENGRRRALRCAIRKSFDWQARIDRFFYGMGKPFPGIISPDLDGYRDDVSRDSITLDIEGAKKLLKDHGWNARTLPVLRVGGVAGVKTRQMFMQLRSFLIKIGYPKQKIKPKEYSTFSAFAQAVDSREVPLIGMGWSMDYPDAENVLQRYYGPNHTPGSNSSNYSNPEFDRLFEAASVLPPGAQRTELYQKAQQLLLDDCVVISGFSRTGIHLWHKNVTMYPRKDVIGSTYKYVMVEE